MVSSTVHILHRDPIPSKGKRLHVPRRPPRCHRPTYLQESHACSHKEQYVLIAVPLVDFHAGFRGV